jgi:DNA-binding beta-propeller fold protein YncE
MKRKRIGFNIIPVLCRLVFFALSLLSLWGCASSGHPVAPNNLTWPPPPETPRIKWLSQWSDEHDFGGQNALLKTLMGPEKIARLSKPNGVTTDKDGNIYVADTTLGLIFVFDMKKNTLRFLGEGTLSAPIGVAIDNQKGIIYVSDYRHQSVFGIDKESGRVAILLGGKAQFKNPSGLAFDQERGRLYVADTKNSVVKMFDRNGQFLATIGKKGSNDGEFFLPAFLAVDNNGNLYVVDSFNFRVQIFDAEGKFKRKFGKIGDSPGFFGRPVGIAVDSEGHIYVVDPSFNNFQIFDQEGKLLLWVGQSGRNPGQFAMPTALYIDPLDRIYVSDTYNARVQVFQYLRQNK